MTTWTEETSTAESWKTATTGVTIWDGGSTVWDVIGNVQTTEWDVPRDSYTEVSRTSESWVDV